jgi:hypothetical protein
MNADRVIEMAKDPTNIIGIFNYCDRWCERCAFTDRCLQYKTMPNVPDAASDEAAMKIALQHVAENFALTRELLERQAAELGIPMPSEEELSKPDPEEDAREERVRDHTVMKAAQSYSDLVGAWFESEAATLRARAEGLVTRVENGGDGEALLMEATQVKNALEIIQYDAYFVAAKIYRALVGREWALIEDDPERDPVQNDHNGSAKVALISIDRSEAAWRVLGQWTGETATTTLVAEHLGKLRMNVEREFPDARRFIRPGFDEPQKSWHTVSGV